MQRSSSSIASLAAALAKAQAALVNPEKSLIGTIPADRPGGSERSFRYASLASGLDIVRKTLGEHEIATVQTTAIDEGAGIINLTTVLAHSSGEWIASDWPVCPIADTAVPHRMGAALTYARRYALFTLVGIAGEDDLDAPALASGSSGGSVSKGKEALRNGPFKANRITPQPAGAAYATKSRRTPVLKAEDSAELRDRLLSQIRDIGSADEGALWAYCNMRAKNSLTPADGRQVELAFHLRLATLPNAQDLSSLGEEMMHQGGPDSAACAPVSPGQWVDTEPSAAARPKPAGATGRKSAHIDKSALAFPEPRRIRDREHIRFVAKQPCLICGRTPSDAHHVRFGQSRALGRKVSDEFTVPLCRGHHREIHRSGDEGAWWEKVSVDPLLAARGLWLRTHPLPRDGDLPLSISFTED